MGITAKNFHFKPIQKLLLVLAFTQMLFLLLIIMKKNTRFDNVNNREKPFFVVKHRLNCANFFLGNFSVISNNLLHRTQKSDVDCWNLFGDCKRLFETHYYPRSSLSSEEDEFSIAYILLVNEHLEQIEILLNSIYRVTSVLLPGVTTTCVYCTSLESPFKTDLSDSPGNVYCIHPCVKSTYYFHQALERLSSCFDNVFVSSERIAVSRSGTSMLLAQRNCLRDLYYSHVKRKHWRYVVTLQGHDFPLRTNAELVKVLTIFNGANDVELLIPPKHRYSNVHKPVFNLYGFENHKVVTNVSKSDPPHNLTLYKGSISSVLNREIVKFALEDQIASDLLDWLNDTYMPDEFFWSTLSHNEFLRIPGGYPGRCHKEPNDTRSWVTRFVVWEGYEHLKCKGRFRQNSCMFSISDLLMLSKRRELFLNKLWITFDDIALDCMHELMFNRTYAKRIYPTNYRFDENYYHKQSVVLYHKWKKDNPNLDSSQFSCVPCVDCFH